MTALIFTPSSFIFARRNNNPLLLSLKCFSFQMPFIDVHTGKKAGGGGEGEAYLTVNAVLLARKIEDLQNDSY